MEQAAVSRKSIAPSLGNNRWTQSGEIEEMEMWKDEESRTGALHHK